MITTRKITALVVDDEPIAREVIKRFCTNYEALEVVGECGSGLTAVQLIEEFRPDLVFLDIQMPDLNGFEVIRESDSRSRYVFTTAHNHYAIEAFEINAIDYLLKPFTEQRFEIAMKKVMQQINNSRENHAQSEIEGLLRTLKEISQHEKTNNYLQRVLVRENKKLFMVALRDVYYFEGSGDYVKIQLQNKSHLINESLTNLEKQVDPLQFVRIHRSFIVNMDHIKEFIPHFNGEYIIVLKNSQQIKMSRSYKTQFHQIIGKQL